jgi:hypothetical protein
MAQLVIIDAAEVVEVEQEHAKPSIRHETLRGQNPTLIYTMNADGTGITPLIHKNDAGLTPGWGSG